MSAALLLGGIVGTLYAELDDRLRKFIARQPVFFVATAPYLTSEADDGHVNVSPKGYADTFAVLGPRTVAYLDLTGSGAETIAHVRQNGHITIMFCSFSHETKVVRLYGRGEVVLPGSPRWAELAGHFPRTADPAVELTSQRAIIVVDLQRVADSCGYSVPEMSLATERDVLDRWAANKSAAQLAAYRAEKNSESIDGLPALELPTLELPAPGQAPAAAVQATW